MTLKDIVNFLLFMILIVVTYFGLHFLLNWPELEAYVVCCIEAIMYMGMTVWGEEHGR